MSHSASISHTEVFDVPAGTVWRLLADWHGIVDWMPEGYIRSVRAEGAGPGAIRHLVTGQGVQLSERLDLLDEGAGRLELSMVGPLPWGLLSYRARARLVAVSPDRCQLTWMGTFETPAAGPETVSLAALLRKSYAKMFLGIRRATAPAP